MNAFTKNLILRKLMQTEDRTTLLMKLEIKLKTSVDLQLSLEDVENKLGHDRLWNAEHSDDDRIGSLTERGNRFKYVRPVVRALEHHSIRLTELNRSNAHFNLLIM